MPHQIHAHTLNRPQARFRPRSMRPAFTAVLLLATAAVAGCSSLMPGSGDGDKEAKLKDLMRVPEPPGLIGEATVAYGMRPIEVEGVGAVNALPGTGGPADPSGFRDQLLEEMKRHDVIDPNHFLESDATALVRVRATIPAGARRGDAVDLRLLAPPESQVEDLKHGWLLDTRLRQQQLIQNTVRQSEVMAVGVGPTLTRAAYTAGDDAALRIEGNVLSGGRVQISRKLGLILRPEYQHAKMAELLSEQINRRFFFFDGTTRRGIAKALEDDFIEIDVHPRYRDNIPRLIEVVRAIRGNAATGDTQTLLTKLAAELRNPSQAADAALQLEAIGEAAVPTLLDSLDTGNPELRFYAAESLAYLERSECVEPLEQAARNEPAFRYLSLLALQGMENQMAVDALMRLLEQPSLETRYGAFCSIRRRAEGKSLLAGRPVGPFWLYQVPSKAPPAVVLSLRESAEVVVMGRVEPLQIPQFLRVDGMILKPVSDQPGMLRVSHFVPGKEDAKTVCSHEVTDVIRAIESVGGDYGDVMSVLREAKAKDYLTSQLAIDPTPKPLRTYHRDDEEQNGSESDSGGETELLGVTFGDE